MKDKILFYICLLSFLRIALVYGQTANLLNAEYFFDSDPGFGNGIPIAFAPDTNITVQLTVDVSGLSPGIHKLYLRAKDDTGKWGIAQPRLIFIQNTTITTPNPDLTEAEYFFNTDPGFGNGSSFSFSSGDSITVTSNIDVSGLNPGLHKLYIRAKDETGKWGITQPRLAMIQLTNVNSPNPYLTAAEYFFDADPGFGNGTDFNFFPDDSISITSSLNVTPLPPGLHKLYIRGKDESGKWGIAQPRLSLIQLTNRETPLPFLTRAEYFFDTDPGFGNASSFSITPDDTIEINAVVPIGGLSTGTHKIYIRAKDENGFWSLAQSDTFTKTISAGVQNGMILFGGVDYQFTWPEITGASHYELVFYFSDSTSTKEPTGFSGDSLSRNNLTNNFYTLTSAELENFVPAKYYWRVLDNNKTPVTSKNVFMKVNLIPPANTSNQPVVLVHGWKSDRTTWEGNFIWNGLKGELINLGYSPWIFEYPNTGDIKQSAWALSVAIDSVLQNNPGFSKVNILAHSMGGLVTRTYTVNIARNFFDNTVSYEDDIDKIAFLATPHRGGRFAYLADQISKIPAIGNITGGKQYSVSQLEQRGAFINELNNHLMNPDIKYLAIGGYDNSLLHWVSSVLLPKRQDVVDPIKLIADIIKSQGISDVWVKLESATKGPDNFFNQYKIIHRNHANIYKNELLFPISPIRNYLQDFYADGIIVSDNYHTFRFTKVAGKIIRRIWPFEDTNFISGAEVQLLREGETEPYITFSDAGGNYSFNYLPEGIYTVKTFANGYLPDSNTVILNDTITSVTQNQLLEVDNTYSGPLNPSVTINSGTQFTTDLQVQLTLSATNATEMIIDEDVEFTNSNWQPFNLTTTYTFSDSSVGTKAIFAKYRDNNLVETTIVVDVIEYDTGSTGGIQITTNIAGADIFLNGNLVGQVTPALIANVPFGEYDVSVNKSGYAPSPTLIPVTVNAVQTYNADFILTDVPPQPSKSFSSDSAAGDTLRLLWETPSDIDLEFTRINYRLDGIFPLHPNDGTVIFDALTQPDSIYTLLLANLIQDTTYYFAAFSKDIGGNYSIGANLSVFAPPTCTPGLLGDITGDGATNSTDGLVLLSYDAGFPLPQPFLDRIAIGFGDVNEDNLTNSTDALITLSWEAGFPVPFPVGQQVCLPDNSRTTAPAKSSPIGLNKTGATIRASAAPANTQLLAGQTIEIPVVVDMGTLPEQLGSYTVALEWNPAVLQFESYRGGSAARFDNPVINTAETTNGKLIAAHACPQGAGGTVNILNLQFKVVGTPGADPGLSLKFTAMAAARTFTDLLPYLELSENLLTVEELPSEYAIANYPNPFNASTEIHYQLPEAVKVEIVLFNVLGQKIRVLVNQRQEAGKYRLTWNGDSEQGQLLPSGIYFLRMRAGRFVADRKLLLLK